MRKELLAYAAGIIDGEGCLGIYYSPKSNGYYSRLQVVMTNAAPLKRLKGLFGGSLVETKMAENGRRVPYHYTVSGKNLRDLLSAVYPFLVEKSSQALVLMELNKSISETNSRPAFRTGIDEVTKQKRKVLYEQAKLLKNTPTGRTSTASRSSSQLAAYAAGVLEAEGCFSISKRHGNCFRSNVTIQMVNRFVVEEIQRILGGSVIGPINRPRTAPRYMWRIGDSRAAQACRVTFKYLTFKQEEADLLRQLQNTTDYWAKKVGRAGMPKHITEKRLGWLSRLRAIHNPARAETKPEQPLPEVCDSPICSELLAAGLEKASGLLPA